MKDLRKQYTQSGLAAGDLDQDPLIVLAQWFDIALASKPTDWFEPNAVTLATASADGQVSARIVLLKGLDADGMLFFTNYDSPKGQQLAENPRAALVIYWPHLERQVRVEGSVARVTRAESEAYFHSRPRGSQIGAVISQQSDRIADDEDLAGRARQVEDQLAGAPVPLPDGWGGYRLTPVSIEFWQGRENRLHDRFRYERQASGWKRAILSP
jgi:pyridoxamine 5'-phosphate oxidase